MTNSDHALDTVRAAVTLRRELAKAEEEAKRLREQSKEAKNRLAAFSKSNRDKSREHDRRAQLVGAVFLDLVADNAPMWLDFRPALEAAMQSATNEDRALFGLPPVKKSSEDQGEKAGANGITTIDDGKNVS